jgi:hypothetical protein
MASEPVKWQDPPRQATYRRTGIEAWPSSVTTYLLPTPDLDWARSVDQISPSI